MMRRTGAAEFVAFDQLQNSGGGVRAQRDHHNESAFSPLLLLPVDRPAVGGGRTGRGRQRWPAGLGLGRLIRHRHAKPKA